VLATGALVPAHPADRTQGWRWQGVFTDSLPDGVPAWSPLAYVCEASWPEEPAWNPDPATVVVPGEVATTWSPAGASPSQWSPPSAALAVRAPQPVIAVMPLYADNGDGTATIAVDVPIAHPSASRWGITVRAAGQPPASADSAGPELLVDGLDASVAAAGWTVAVTTPGGTTLPMVKADGTPA
jgi:hypothetical protein